MQKNVLSVVLIGGLAWGMVGCQNTQTRAVEGSVIGGLVGAAAGGIIGHQSGHGGEGALIGAAGGALTGAVVGSQIEKPKTAAATQASSEAGAQAMSVVEVLDMARQGTSDDIIIDKIRTTKSKFELTDADVTYLKQQGVSDRVISAMKGVF